MHSVVEQWGSVTAAFRVAFVSLVYKVMPNLNLNMKNRHFRNLVVTQSCLFKNTNSSKSWVEKIKGMIKPKLVVCMNWRAPMRSRLQWRMCDEALTETRAFMTFISMRQMHKSWVTAVDSNIEPVGFMIQYVCCIDEISGRSARWSYCTCVQ